MIKFNDIKQTRIVNTVDFIVAYTPLGTYEISITTNAKLHLGAICLEYKSNEEREADLEMLDDVYTPKYFMPYDSDSQIIKLK